MQCSIFYSWFQRKWEHNQFYSWPQWNTNMNDKFSTGLWKQEDLEHGPGIGLGLQRESTAVGKGLQNPFACFACSRALESHAGNCLQLCRRDHYPSAVGWRGRPGFLRLFLPSPSQLCPFSLSPSFSLQKAWAFIPGQKRSFFPVLQRNLELCRQDMSRHSCNVIIVKESSVRGFYQAQRGAFTSFPCFPTDFHSQFMVCCDNDSRRGPLDLAIKA